MPKINSRSKGAAGERDLVNYFKEKHNIEGKRNFQFRSGHDGADITLFDGVHIEVKRVERINLEDAFTQANDDKLETDIPVIIHRKNHKPWTVSFRLDDLKLFLERFKIG